MNPFFLIAIGALVAWFCSADEKPEKSDEHSGASETGCNRGGGDGGREPNPTVEVNHRVTGEPAPKDDDKPDDSPTPKTGKE